MHRRHMLGAILALALTSAVPAQEVTGGLDGRVLSPTRAPLAQVEVTASSPSLMRRRAVRTDARGRFLIPVLPVGTYRLELRRLGYQPQVFEQLPVRLGETTTLTEVILKPTPVQLTEVFVNADAAGIDPNNTAQRIVLDAKRLDALPLERNFRETMLLAPAAVPSFLGRDGGGAGVNRDGINIAGATGYENTYFVDGINITSPIRGETSIDLPYNFIQQMDVRTGGSTADDAQSLGGVVNVVTPNGSDRLKAQVFGFFANDGLEAPARPVSGYYQTGFTFYDAGASVSGPLVRDRLRFFAAYDENYERRDHTYSFGSLRATHLQHLFAGKLIWQASARTSGFITIIGDPSRSRPLVTPLFGNGVPLNAEVLERSDKAGGVGISARAHHLFASGALLEVAVSQMTRLESGEPATTAGRAATFIDYVDGTLSGGESFGYRQDSRRRTAQVNVSWPIGPHALKAGVQYEELHGDLSMDLGAGSGGGTIERGAPNTYTWHINGARNGRGTNRNPSLFLQDNWQLTPRLSVNAGVRWSRQDLRDDGSTSVFPGFRIRDGFQPRAGIVYQPGTLGTQRVFASFSRAAEQLPVWGFQDFAAGAESLLVYTHDPRQDPTGGVIQYVFVNGVGTAGDRDVRGQTVDTWALGYGRQYRGLSFSLTAMRRALQRVVAAGNDSTLQNSIWGNPGYGAMSNFPRMSRTYDAIEATIERRGAGASWFRVSYVWSRTRGNYPGLYGSDWRLGFTNFGPMFILPQQYVNGTGLLPNDRTHVLKLFGSRHVRPRLDVGASLLLASGTPLSEYGGIVLGAPFRGFARQRGTAGRTPAIWDLGVRASYDLPRARNAGIQTHVMLDIQHLGSPRKAVDYDQWHYTCVDASGNQSCANVGYGRVLQYQPPMMARLGLVMDLARSP